MPAFEDVDYSNESLTILHNVDLANNPGNLIFRTQVMGDRIGYVISSRSQIDAATVFHEAMKDYRFGDALAVLWHQCDDLNRLFETPKPWNAIKVGLFCCYSDLCPPCA